VAIPAMSGRPTARATASDKLQGLTGDETAESACNGFIFSRARASVDR
jgi:hypothetical protein